MAALRGIDGGLSAHNRATTEADAAVEAWAYIADAAGRALRVPGLSPGDVDDLREVRRSANEIADKPPLVGVPNLAPTPPNRPGAA